VKILLANPEPSTHGTKEWRYYTSDKEEFIAKFNAGLKGHPAYPIRMQLFADPEWKALAELLAKSS